MGAAAYYRGNALITRQAEEGRRAIAFQVMDRLSALPKYPDAGMPFGPIHFIPGHGGWWVECPRTGFGYWYKTLPEAIRCWRVDVTGYDATLGIWHAEPIRS